MLQEYPLLFLGPFDIILEYRDLGRVAIRNGVEEVQKGSNYRCKGLSELYSLYE